MRNLVIFGILTFFFSIKVFDAYAYVDPGTGSIIIQVIIGALAGAAITLKIYWYKIKAKFIQNKK